METIDNATVRIVCRDEAKMVFRVYPDGTKLAYKAGQYGALGLPVASPRIDGTMPVNPRPGAWIKRPYSIASSILDEDGRPMAPEQKEYYEFYVDLVSAQETLKSRLSPRLFSLRDHDRIFCGHKIVGHYTLEAGQGKRKILFVGTTTGEAPHNAMIAQILREQNPPEITHMVIGPPGWESAYASTHQRLMKEFARYRFIAVQDDGSYTQTRRLIREMLSDKGFSRGQRGWALDPRDTHAYLCGDPLMIGAPRKLGAWQYEYPREGLMTLLQAHGFQPASRFQTGNISYEAYW
jgi:ferredoxin--NADP+ reductase